ncbi:MAG: LacI family DNA-binding transcriptional regulator, partial [Peptoniphilaceae bacterium]|nr:LacI family DNA-binding transcriptional regulator [Peptoniphilaceae bacterium]MDY6018676.1 LacI family DNA-binding transcriptional regulator [Anaerococcus sp.]
RFISEKGELPLIIEAEGISSDNGYNIGEEALKVIKENNVTAVSCINDKVAIGFINYCFDHNINVPEDLSVVGFGDSSIAKVFRPKLTTMSIPYYDMGAIAIRALIKRIRGEEEILGKDWIMDGQLEIRDTSKKI